MFAAIKLLKTILYSKKFTSNVTTRKIGFILFFARLNLILCKFFKLRKKKINFLNEKTLYIVVFNLLVSE